MLVRRLLTSPAAMKKAAAGILDAGELTALRRTGAKKLAGAAKTSFMKKCESDAQIACDKQAADKKLSGAAKDSFTKKCVTDTTGT